MNEAASPTNRPRKRRSILRTLLWIVAGLVVLLVAAFFYLTSAGFVKRTVLPRVGESMNAEITVSDATIHPFSSIELRNLKVTPRNRETLLTATEVRARYDLWSILRGNILVEEVTLASPMIHIVTREDGTSNLDPLLQSVESEDPEDAQDSDSETPRIDVRQFSISRAFIRHETHLPGGQRNLIEITNAAIHLTNLKNGDSGKLVITAGLAAETQAADPGAAGALEASLAGEYVFALSTDLKPLSVKGESQLRVQRAAGAFSDLAELSALIAADIAPTEITGISLQFARAGEGLGRIEANGPFNSERLEGRLHVNVLALDRRVLNLVGAPLGFDFGTTAINSTNLLELGSGGAVVSVIGGLDVARFQLVRTNQSTPTLDLQARYQAGIDLNASNAVLHAFTLSGTQNGRPLVRGELNSPMTISLGGNNGAAGDATLNLGLENLNLAEWKALATDLPSGTVNARLSVQSRQSGSAFGIDAKTDLANIAPIGEGQTLRSASLVANVGLQMAGDQTTVNGTMQFSNVVVVDPSGTLPETPLEARLEVDTAVAGDVIDIRRLIVGLTPTDRADNRLQVQGRIDLADTNAITGNLKLSAEALDLTDYYELFRGGTTSNAPDAKSETSSAGSTASDPTNAEQETEPEAIALPFRDFVAEAAISRFFLGEIAASNLITRIQLDSGLIRIQPFELTMNGAPVRADVNADVSVPGYRYALKFDADGVPFAPLVNTFAPERKNELGGTLFAAVDIRGAGVTGASLQNSLAGTFDIGTTNLNLSAANIRQPMLKLLVSVIAMVPSLAENPGAALGSLVGGVGNTLTRGLAGSFGGDLTNSPLDVITLRGRAGEGVVEVQQATVRSTAFRADTAGTVTLAPVLTNSAIRFPVTIALVRPLAERLKMVPADTPTNAAYVKLPDFFAEGGTLGAPKAEIDRKVLAGSLLQTVGNLIPGATATNSPVGNVIQGLGTLLGNRPANSSTNAPPGTISAPPSASVTNSAPATNSPLSDVLRLLGPRTRQQ